MATFIWQDGKALRTEAPVAKAGDRGLTLGDALFETLPAFMGQPFRLDDHLARLRASAEALFIPLDQSACRALFEAALAHHGGENIILRLEVTRGVSARGLHLPEEALPSYFLLTSPWSPAFLEGAPSLTVSGIRRNETSPASRHKTANYLDNIMALEAAKRAGFDDALLINMQGHAACVTTANIFAIQGKRLLTPPLQDGVLPGIVRAMVLTNADACGLEAVETSLTPDDVKAAECLFITNSARLMLPVSRLDEKVYDLQGMPDDYRRLKARLHGRMAAETGYDAGVVA